MDSSAAAVSGHGDALLVDEGERALIAVLARVLAARERGELCERVVEGLAGLVPCEELVLYACGAGGELRPVAGFPRGRVRALAAGRGGEAGEAAAEALLMLPLEVEGAPAGALVLRRYGGRAEFMPSERERAAAFASLSALALARVEREAALAEQARRDWLTGLYNRGHCQTVLDELCRKQARFGLLLVDLDDLKVINDRFGHPRGDELLRGFGQALPRAIRSGDLAFRVGGDEFLLLLPGAGEAEAVCLAGRIERRLPRLPGLPALGFSHGIAVAPADGKSPDELLCRVDGRLYEGKRQRKRPVGGDSSQQSGDNKRHILQTTVGPATRYVARV